MDGCGIAREDFVLNSRQGVAGVEDVVDEIFDMVKPEVPGRISLTDLKRCGCADVVIEILCDHTGFWKYDNRESLPSDDDNEEELEEDDGQDLDQLMGVEGEDSDDGDF